eukprot:CAMPEP_0194506098 /NCGR_PEP_ID=MMETSP0253-20130528/33784_1 /TAXON_ID=2966 /ORGANISM="Noctiluca scintillans" /LENGTH=75 /DNA_ID=CAMNT_0039348749 /DNA_START=69 /DNA_END=296 /DNA_ORIENTATION=-
MDGETRDMVCGLQSSIEGVLGRTFGHFEPTSYSTQVVAGVNYGVSIAVDGGVVNVVIFKGFDGRGEVSSAKFAAH